MKILHIARMKPNAINGINVAVPCHIISESYYCDVYFYNAYNEKISNLSKYQVYSLDEDLLKKIDVVIFHEVFKMQFLKISKILRKHQIKYYILPHGSLTKVALSKKALKKKVARIILFNKFIYNSNGIITLSHSEKESLDNKIKGLNIILSSNGIDNSHRKKINFNKEIVKYLYIGRLDYIDKGFDVMLDALFMLKEKGMATNVTVDIFGPDASNERQKLIDEINKRNLNDIVFLYGPVVGEEKEEQLLSHDIFFQTSKSEGLPMGIIEALNYGIPCLCTKGTSLGEIVRDHNMGWCAENNADSVYEALLISINERNRWMNISKNAIDYTIENYNWSKISKELIEDIFNNKYN